MFVDSLIVPECVYRPGSFTGLMTIYESNFIKLNQLLRDLPADRTSAVSRTREDCDLHLTLLRSERYTTTLKLTYWFDELGPKPVPDPDLTLRIYHDARLVEAVGARHDHLHRKLRELDGGHVLELGRRWRNNIMLNKWLDYLLDMGHGFRQ